ncbi:MAG: TetR/AcrR family transcriptional regulator, partial [Gammaproteobacteria bacterium]|nr:TetR/AcrR family transcriptional regulator [Gammaproteobacteria bacterium]
LFGAFNWLPYWHRDGGEEDYAEITKQFLATFLDGLKRRNQP